MENGWVKIIDYWPTAMFQLHTIIYNPRVHNNFQISLRGRNHRENLVATSAMVGRIFPPPGGDSIKVSENLGATAS